MKILLFGIVRDIIGGSVLEIDHTVDESVEKLMDKIQSKYPALKELTSLMIAVNNEYAKKDQVLNENDEIALIPPVSGG